MENILIFQPSTDTIRQMPQNYLIAQKVHNKWLLDFDPAADKELILRVFNAIYHKHENMYGSGLNLLAQVTPNSEFTNP